MCCPNPDLSQAREHDVDSQSPDSSCLQIVFTVGHSQQHSDAHHLGLVLKSKAARIHQVMIISCSGWTHSREAVRRPVAEWRTAHRRHSSALCFVVCPARLRSEDRSRCLTKTAPPTSDHHTFMQLISICSKSQLIALLKYQYIFIHIDYTYLTERNSDALWNVILCFVLLNYSRS